MPGLVEIVVSAVVFAIFFATNKIRKVNVDLFDKGEKHDK